MCDLQCGNLIDLSLEDDLVQTLTTQPIKTENEPSPAPTHPSFVALVPDAQFVSPSYRKRDSLDNNPFDSVQKLANQPQDDPFDIVEKEACFKARLSFAPPVEVKLGNLLSLSIDNVDVDDMQLDMEAAGKKTTKCYDLEAVSSPVVMTEKIIAVGSCSETDSNPNSSAESAGSSKMKKAMEYRKRLLKLSCTNSALNSPASHKSSLDDPGTPLSSLLSKSSQYGENLLAAESPLKFVDDDIMAEESPLSLDAEKNFEADLEMLKIPMLNEIPSSENESFLLDIESKLLDSLNCMETGSNARTGLEAIKAKLKAKRMESNNNHHQDINTLISDLKSLINSGDSVNDTTKIQATTILETLSSALSTSHAKDNLPISQQEDHHHHLAAPQPIKRQGTFDIELQEDNGLVQEPFVDEMPNCMTSSSATYDGDAPEERHVLDLPEIEPPSSTEKPSSELTMQSDMNDIMEQLSKLFIHNSGDNSHNTQQNPTFIVVMNTTPMQQNHSNYGAKENSAKGPSYLEDSFHDNSPDLNVSRNKAPTRRRSQSLSIHDKVKIVKLPLKPPTPNKRMQQQHSVDVSISPPVVTTPPSNDLSTSEFKTPARRVRCNSYSSVTPCTTAVGLRKTGFSSDGNSIIHVRRTATLDTHHEAQQQQQKAIVRPMTLSANNMAIFKPDLKKKHKAQGESIMKSSGPLKATIPVKKVVPIVMTCPPSPDQLSGCSLDSSAQLKKMKIPTTPVSSSRSLSKLAVGPGYPNACSTPSAFTSPMKRTSAGIIKPRYSYMTATPNLRPTTASSASEGLRRRSIADFKVRSPLKSRASSAGLSAAATSVASTSSRVSAPSSRLSTSASSSRLSTSACAKFPSKTPTKFAPKTAAVKPTGRIAQPRLSGFGPARSTRNKENKNP